MRFGTVAIVGRSNVGKSTLLNALLGEPLAAVSPRPQTTRDSLLGVLNRPNAQIAFVDTPGFHRPRTELGRRMNAAAREAARGADVVVLMTDVSSLTVSRREATKEPFLEDDSQLLLGLPADATVLVVINKIDLLKDKARLLPMMARIKELRNSAQCVPVSALTEDGVALVVDAITDLLPEGPAAYDSSTLTDRSTAFFVKEYIREQTLLSTRSEVPHAVAVSVEKFVEARHAVVIKATIHVEKSGQRIILIGKGGSKIKEIGTLSRKRIEALVGRKVHLELFVRVTPRWKDVPRQLAELGYDAPASGRSASGSS
jgi:GTP-binding protein Era